MAEYSRIAKGHFTSTGNAQIINLPFQPDRIEMVNLSLVNAGAAASKILTGYWDVSMGQGLGLVQAYTSGSALVWDNIPSNGFSTFSAGLMLQYGPLQLLGASAGAGIALTSATVLTVTTAAANTTLPGDWVVFQNLYETATTGMQQISGIPFQVQAANWSTTSFQVAWNGTGTGLTAIDTSATGAAGYRKILYPTLYDPGIAFPFAITVSAGVGTVTTTAPHNFQVGQEIVFRIPSTYGAQNLNELPNTLTPGQPQVFYVASVPTATSFTFNSAPALTTAFNLNQTFVSFPGLKFAQVVAIGDVNTGGNPYTGGALYPSPTVNTNLTASSTINGPAIQGAYINNTSQGFIIGSGAGRVVTAGSLVGANTNVIYWTAYLSDLAVN